MHLRSVVGGLVAKESQCTFEVSTIGGKTKQNIRVESTAAERFCANDPAECMRQYLRWQSAVRSAAVLQHIDAPGQCLQTSITTLKSPGVADVARHIVEAGMKRLEKADNVELVEKLRLTTARDIYDALKEWIFLDDDLHQADAASVEYGTAIFGSFDTDPEKEVPSGIPAYLRPLVNAAKAKNKRALTHLRRMMEDAGRRFAITQKTHLSPDTRFFWIVKYSEPLFQLINLFDLRWHFAKGLFEKSGWHNHVCLKFPGDPKSPMGADIGVTVLAEQMDEIEGIHEPGPIALKH